MKSPKSGRFLKQSPRARLRLNRTVAALSLIMLLAGGGLFFYLNTGRVESSKAAASEVIVITEPQPETGLSVAGAQRNAVSDRYAGRTSQNDNSVFVRSLK